MSHFRSHPILFCGLHTWMKYVHAQLIHGNVEHTSSHIIPVTSTIPWHSRYHFSLKLCPTRQCLFTRRSWSGVRAPLFKCPSRVQCWCRCCVVGEVADRLSCSVLNSLMPLGFFKQYFDVRWNRGWHMCCADERHILVSWLSGTPYDLWIHSVLLLMLVLGIRVLQSWTPTIKIISEASFL